jgi:phenylpropionate dioxygenase-like ring-hydroxylating dioxygenase large terminal subunit
MSVALVGGTREDMVGTAISSVGNTEGSPVQIPADRYRTKEFADLEHEHVWPKAWIIACSIDHVSKPGDLYEVRIGRYSVLIVRGRDGELRAFQNACKHRGIALCSGSAEDVKSLRCPYHGWMYNLRGELTRVPSHKGFGKNMDKSKLSLTPVLVDTWGPMVFINLDADAMPLSEFLEVVPEDAAGLEIDDFRCYAKIRTEIPANWKLVADSFSETYHVQTLHREMLGSIDDIDAGQEIWGRTGVSRQLYGVASPRLMKADDQGVWDSFIITQGERMGITESCPAPTPQGGETMMDVIGARVKQFQKEEKGIDLGRFSNHEVMYLHQYNIFPNLTVLISADILQVLCARPGATPDQAELIGMTFEREKEGVPRARPFDVDMPMDQAGFGFVLNQDVEILKSAQRGIQQPGLTHISLSCEEARIINNHRNLERYIGIEPSEILGGPA